MSLATAALSVLVVLTILVLVASFGLLVNLGARQLNTPLAIAHDGPRAGRPTPRVTVTAIDDTAITVPGGRRQVVLFTDHSLMDFEDLLAMLVTDDADRPDVVVLGSADRTNPALLEGLALRVPAAVVPHEVYDRFRIRVMPYAVVVDAAGRVATSGLVNTPFQLRHLAQVGLETGRVDASTPNEVPS